MSIPEIATKIIDSALFQTGEDNARSIFLVGSKSVGKSTLLYSFLDKTEMPRETLVLEYSFGRKSNQKQGIEKTVCHVWEYGGKLDVLKNVLPSVPLRGKYYFCLMVDLSKMKGLWYTIETCIQALNVTSSEQKNIPELIIIGGKYDLFKNYDSEIKKFICTTLRSIALLFNAYILFYSSKEQQLVRRAKDMFHSIGFGNGIPFKEKITNFTKPLMIPKGTDTWENIGISPSTIEQIKLRHVTRIASDSEVSLPVEHTSSLQRNHPEAALDTLVALKYDELRNIESLDISVNEYLMNLHY